MIYSAIIVAVSEGISLGSKAIDEAAPSRLKCCCWRSFWDACWRVRRRQCWRVCQQHAQTTTSQSPARTGLDNCVACFMHCGFVDAAACWAPHAAVQQAADSQFTTGNSSEILAAGQFPGWGMIAVHVMVITLLSNIGKCFRALLPERSHPEGAARTSIGMFPRGEVGAGMLVLSLSYGIAGPR